MKSLSIIINRLSLILLCISLCHFVSYGFSDGESISGRLVDKQGRPIPFATVVLSQDSLSQDVVAHTLSDRDGAFSFKNASLASGKAWLTIRSIGFHKLTVPVSKQMLTNLHIQMEEDVAELPDVVVKGVSPDMYAKGDTVVYRSQNYRIGHEKSMGDIVSRMPGVQINPSGLVYFLGRPISKLLVNGSDVLTSSIASNLETFSSDFADEVEVITDYDDGSIDQNMRGEKKIALNLKTQKTLHSNGWIDLAGGVKKKYNTRASLISVVDKLSFTGKFNANNIGDRWILWGDYSNLTSSSHSFGGEATNTIIYNADEAEMLIPNANMYVRNGGAGVLSFIFMPNKKYRIELNNTLHRSQSQKQFFYDQLFLQNNASLLGNQQTLDESRHLLFGAHQLDQRWLPNKYFSIENRTRIEYTNGGAEEFSENLLRGYSSSPHLFKDIHTRAYTGIANDIEIKKVKGGTLLFIGNKSSWRQNKKNSEWDSNDKDMGGIKMPETTPLLLMPYQLNTSEHSNRVVMQNYLGVATPVISDNILRTELRYNYDYRMIEQEQGVMSPLKEYNVTQRLSAYLSLMKNRSAFIYNLSIEGGWLTLNHSLNKKMFHKRSSFLTPRIELGYRPSNLHRLLLSSSYDIFSYSATSLSQMEYQSSYRGERKASKVDDPFYRVWSSTLDYSYSNLKNKLFINTNVSYSTIFNDVMSNLRQESIRYILFYTDGGRSDRLVAKCNGSYSLPSSPLDLQMSIGYSINSNQFVSNQVHDTLRSQEFSVATGIQTRFRSSPINALIHLSLSEINQEYQQRQWTQRHHLVGANGQVYGHYQKLSMRFSMGHQWLKSSNKVWRFLDLGFSLRYNIQKVVLELRGKDITHISNNQWVVNDATMEYIATALYQQMPGHIMFSVHYTF